MKPRALCLLVGVVLVAGQSPAQAAQFGDFAYEFSGTAVAITGYTGPGGSQSRT
jgi:nicotinamide mononucleotide (NMN) deamidase PncC